jgi:hypothetical protein
LHIPVCYCFVLGRYTSFGVLLHYWPLAGLSVWVVTCEGGKPYLYLLSLLPFQNPRSLGTSPLGLTSLKRKNHPIVVTLGGIGSCYASLTFYLITFYPSYKLCENNNCNGVTEPSDTGLPPLSVVPPLVQMMAPSGYGEFICYLISSCNCNGVV